MVYPCNEIQKVAWDVIKNFDHALILREDDPLLPAILDVYEKQGIKNGHPQNKMKGEAFKTPLATAYPDCRLVVTKETMTVEGMIKIVYDLLKEFRYLIPQGGPMTGIGNNLSGIFASHVSGSEGMSVASAQSGYTMGFWILMGFGVLLFLIAPLIQRLMHGVK